jgi:predicted glycogen debranching enzyme
MIYFDQSVCADLDRASQHEWLETNGIGGFSSSTIVGLNTRRYHGLLTAAIKSSAGRIVMLSKVEEELVVDSRRHQLSLKEFRLDPFPTSVYQAGGVELEKRIFMPHGENTVVIEYELRAVDCDPLPACSLELRPLIVFRDHQAIMHRSDGIDRKVRIEDGLVALMPYHGTPALYCGHDADSVELTGDWYNGHFHEDLFNPFLMRFDFHRRAGAALIASLEPRPASDVPALKAHELARRREQAACVPFQDPLARQLALADQFVERGELSTVVAGYH